MAAETTGPTPSERLVVTTTDARTRTDAELIDAVRQGHESAYAELYARHRTTAYRLASSYRRADEPEDLVHESFELVLAAIKRGTGPDEAFRAYLFVTLRRLAAERLVRSRDEPFDEVPEPAGALLPRALDAADRDMVLSAYQSLPERSRDVLWQSTVEGRQPRELASTLGVSANAAAALAYRAREKLRQAYLQAHVHATPRPGCEPHRSRLGGYVRDGLCRRDQAATRTHIDGCRRCTTLVGELQDINHMLVRAMRPSPVTAPVDAPQAVGSEAPATGGWARRWMDARSERASVRGAAAAAAAATLLLAV
jgi:RNA polymerase sigma factor (sigma-70 family)